MSGIVFGTDGWRGLIADDFTFANVRKVTRAIATYLQDAYDQSRPVLVAYDTRFLADTFAQTAAEVLAAAGWTVQMVDRDCPTPVIAYAAKFRQSAGALMFTASHNPAPYCGIKYIPDYAGPATPDITDKIVSAIAGASEDVPTQVPTDKISRFDPRPEYLEFLYQQLDVATIRQAHLNVIYDALYSTSRGYVDEALRHCGCTIEVLHAHRDVLFGGGMPEPKGEQLVELVLRVKESGSQLGLATDGDSDRFGIVDETGTVLTPNMVLLALAKHLVKNRGKKGAIVRTVATTHLLDNLAQNYGLEIYETAVGFKYIGEKMRQTPVLIGGEESGGLSVLGHIPEKDGVLADLLIVEMVACEGKPLSQIVAEVVAESGGPLVNYRLDLHLPNPHKVAVMQHFRTNPPQQVAGMTVKEVGLKDGVKLSLEDGSWILLRPSGTEPLLRVYMETKTTEQKEAITTAMQATIDQLKP
ncbi:MAG: phosphoglucomutase/phosphomannomutase family protein [Synechococcales cyanobacterium]